MTDVKGSVPVAIEPSDELIVRFPARSGYLEISRLNATAMAASAGFDVTELDDVRLAVNEAVAWLLDDGVDGGVELTIGTSPGELRFRGVLSGPRIPELGLPDLLHAILGATTDSYEAGLDDDGNRFLTIVKRTADG